LVTSGRGTGFNEYFTASLDGDETFLPPVRVSTEPSRPVAGGNLTYTPTTFTTPGDSGAVRMVFLLRLPRCCEWVRVGFGDGLDEADPPDGIRSQREAAGSRTNPPPCGQEVAAPNP
jgi:hypothetical protein